MDTKSSQPDNASPPQSRFEILRKTALFKDLSDHELELLASRLQEVRVPNGQQLLVQGEPASRVFWLVAGAVHVIVNGEIIAQVDNIQCFGEMSCLVPGSHCSATVASIQDCTILSVDRVPFLEVLSKNIIVASNGKKALTILNDHFNAETPIDLLFSDWNMPILSGIDLLIAVRQSENFKDLLFIMVTAEGQRDQVMLAIKVGVSNYIVKPFPPVQLELKIQAVWDKLTARKKNQINKPSEESIASDQSQASVEANASDQSQGSDQNTST